MSSLQGKHKIKEGGKKGQENPSAFFTPAVCLRRARAKGRSRVSMGGPGELPKPRARARHRHRLHVAHCHCTGKGKGGGGRGFGGSGKGKGKGRVEEGPPDSVVVMGEFMHPCEGDLIVKSTNEKVPSAP